MQTLAAGTRGLSLLFQLNWDRMIYAATILAALLAGAWVGTLYPV